MLGNSDRLRPPGRAPKSARICIDARIVGTSTGTYAERLLEHLQTIDHDSAYTVLLDHERAPDWSPSSSNFRAVRIGIRNYSLSEQTRFLRYLRRERFDLVHFCMPQQPIAYRGRTITTFHDLTLLRTYNSDKNWFKFRGKQLIGRVAFRAAARKSTRLLVPSQYTGTDLATWLPGVADKIDVTPEAAEVEDKTYDAVDLPFDRFLLYVGSHSDYKNTKRLVDAHQELLQDTPRLGLAFAGRFDKAMVSTQAYCDRIEARNVEFLGFVSIAQRNWLYQNAEVYVFPSLMEGFGLPGLEAMLHGCPVASSNATSLPEVYGEAAVYFDPLSVSSMKGAIGSLLSDDAKRADLALRGRHRVSEFSWRRMAEQTLAAYRAALEDSEYSRTGPSLQKPGR